MGDDERRAAAQDMQGARTKAAGDLQESRTALAAVQETEQALDATEQAIAAHRAAHFQG